MLGKSIKLVTFDVTNTLLRFAVPPWERYGIVAREHGYQGDDEEIARRLSIKYNSMWQTYPNFGKGSHLTWEAWWMEVVRDTIADKMPTPANTDSLAKRLIDEYKSASLWRCVDGAESIINFFRKCGLTVGVISNFDPRLHEILKNVSLSKYFDFILTSYEAGFFKPDRRIFDEALNFAGGLQPQQCMHIGDDFDKDYRAPRCAGWHAYLVNEYLPIRQFITPHHIFNDLSQMKISLELGKVPELFDPNIFEISEPLGNDMKEAYSVRTSEVSGPHLPAPDPPTANEGVSGSHLVTSAPEFVPKK